MYSFVAGIDKFHLANNLSLYQQGSIIVTWLCSPISAFLYYILNYLPYTSEIIPVVISKIRNPASKIMGYLSQMLTSEGVTGCQQEARWPYHQYHFPLPSSAFSSFWMPSFALLNQQPSKPNYCSRFPGRYTLH